MQKRIPLMALLIAAFFIGLLNVLISGRLSVHQPWKILEQLALISIIYWWYRTDKSQRQYRAGPLLNIGVVALSIVAIPVYLFRSRGAAQGAKAFALFLVFFVVLIVAVGFGGAIGKLLTP